MARSRQPGEGEAPLLSDSVELTLAAIPLETRAKDFAENVDALQSHGKRLVALVSALTKRTTEGSAKTRHCVTQDESDEIEAEALLVEQLIHSIGEKYAGIPAPPGTFARPIHPVLSDRDRRSQECRAVQRTYLKLRETLLDALQTLASLASPPEATKVAGDSQPPTGGGTQSSTMYSRDERDGKNGSADSDDRKRNPVKPPRQGKVAKEREQMQRVAHTEPSKGSEQQQQQLLLETEFRTVNVDEEIERERKTQLKELVENVEELHRLKAEFHNLTLAQGANLEQIEASTATTATKVEKGRDQLVSASKFKLAGAWIGGAIIGGLIAGPAGALAGAKGAGAVVGITAGGAVVGGLLTTTAAHAVHSHNVDFDDYQPNRRPTKKEQ
jgi:hypothetical protein